METSKKPSHNAKHRPKTGKRNGDINWFTGNKLTGQGFADKRKKAILREHYRQLRKNKKTQKEAFKQPLNKEITDSARSNSRVPQPKKKAIKANVYKKALLQHEQKVKERKVQKESFLKKREESEKAMKQYHDRKLQRQKKFSKKTKRGQPAMGSRMEFLLKHLQEKNHDL